MKIQLSYSKETESYYISTLDKNGESIYCKEINQPEFIYYKDGFYTSHDVETIEDDKWFRYIVT